MNVFLACVLATILANVALNIGRAQVQGWLMRRAMREHIKHPPQLGAMPPELERQHDAIRGLYKAAIDYAHARIESDTDALEPVTDQIGDLMLASQEFYNAMPVQDRERMARIAA